jgi:N-acetylglutamate synthase-like GNAT family acetyltransferase
LHSKKIFFITSFPGLTVGERFQSHPLPSEIDQSLEGEAEVNIGKEALTFLHEQQQSHLKVDLILLEAKPGTLFREVFTHRGAGTLLSKEFQDSFRVARLADVRDISILMAPYIESDVILPVSEDDLAGEIKNYYVNTVNNEVVATAKLTEYGESCEIAKICTLPRYRGKGRAKKLVLELIACARALSKKRVFALSIEPKMATFFKALNFEEVRRRKLPAAWKKHYDFRRPSRAFELWL